MDTTEKTIRDDPDMEISSLENTHNSAEPQPITKQTSNATATGDVGGSVVVDNAAGAKTETEAQPASNPQLQNSQVHDPPPDGGWYAWLQVMAAFVVMVATYGLINSFGVFQTYYETELLSSHPPTDISWIGSIQGALLLMMGSISGPLYDMGYFRYLTAGGLLLICLGMFMTSLATTYWQVLLAQGVCVGLGCGFAFLPTTAVLSQYFAKRRAIAIGIQSVGSPLAGIVFPILFDHLLPVVGFPWATRVLAFILLGLSAVPLAFLRPRLPPPERKRRFFETEAFHDKAYMVYGTGAFFGFLGLYVPFFYIQLYVMNYAITPGGFSTSYLVTLLNVGSVFGRLLPNFFADLFGSLQLLTLTTVGAMAVILGWLGVRDFPSSIVFVLLYGFFNGGMTSLPPSASIQLTPDLSKIGSRLGTSFLFFGASTLIGTPVAGAIVGHGDTDTEWMGLILFAGLGMAVGSMLYGTSLLMLKKRERRKQQDDSMGGNSTE